MNRNKSPQTEASTGKPGLKKAGTLIKAVLFDFDGTLTEPGALDFPEIKKSISCPDDMAILEYIDTISDPDEKQRIIQILDKAEEAAAKSSRPNRDAEEILAWLKSRGLLIGIITRNALSPVIIALEKFKNHSLDDFDVVVSREDPIQPKPSPESVNLAMQRLGVDASESVMIGDYLFDIAAGNGAGVTTILVPAPGEQRDVPDWGQDHLIRRLDELKPLFEFHLPIPGGKLPNRYLDSFLTSLHIPDPSVIVSPGVGEDTAAVDIEDDEVLVLKSDPITFVSEQAARYAVTINANDIATSGATPRWFLSTLLFPNRTTPKQIVDTMRDLQEFCQEEQITLCGGHTEITDAVNRLVVSGMVIGTVRRDRLIDKKQMKTGDHVFLTKTVAVEGTAILAQEFRQALLQKGLTEADIRNGLDFLEMISIRTEAGIAAACEGVTAMHDVTEGGLATALEELSYAGRHGIRVDMVQLPVHNVTHRICSALDIDPLGLIGSGGLLITCDPEFSDGLLSNLMNSGIPACQIGVVTETGTGIQAETNGKPNPWPRFETDELARLYS